MRARPLLFVPDGLPFHLPSASQASVPLLVFEVMWSLALAVLS
jgi:hypothetical protein